MTRKGDVEDQADAAVVVGLTRDELRVALYGLDTARRGHTAAGRPVPQPVMALLRRLETVHRTKGVEESTCRPFGGGAEQLTSWIGTGQAAELLGISCRAVWRRRHDLDGQQINGRWWYPAATIQDMKRHKEIDA